MTAFDDLPGLPIEQQESIRSLVDEAPPMTDETVAKIAVLLRTGAKRI
jgi:hypothetical protein